MKTDCLFILFIETVRVCISNLQFVPMRYEDDTIYPIYIAILLEVYFCHHSTLSQLNTEKLMN